MLKISNKIIGLKILSRLLIVWHMDQPLADPVAIPFTLPVMRQPIMLKYCYVAMVPMSSLEDTIFIGSPIP